MGTGCLIRYSVETVTSIMGLVLGVRDYILPRDFDRHLPPQPHSATPSIGEDRCSLLPISLVVLPPPGNSEIGRLRRPRQSGLGYYR
jgi:hypothetical protein